MSTAPSLPHNWRENPTVAAAVLERLREAKSARARRQDFATPGDLARALDPTTVQTPALQIIDAALCRVANGDSTRLIISMPPQEGKALALDTPIATPTGWTTMGELAVGDVVFDRHGNPCNVTWVSPVWNDRPAHIVTTGDREQIVADAAHEWLVRLDRRSSERIVETRVLAGKRAKNAQITAGAILNLPEAELPLDPYVLGAWLGDGSTRAAMITSHPDDTHIRERIAAAGFPVRYRGKFAYSLSPERARRSPIRVALAAAGVWGNKHIPTAYLRSSAAQRLALLQGLIDTDGHVSSKGQVEFTNTNLTLAEGVRELVYSLGAKAVLTVGRATIDGRDVGAKYRVRFYLAGAASLPRKAALTRNSSVAAVRYVTAIATDPTPTVCIEVDSPDHTFLAGRTMLPTHNSERTTHYGALWMLHRNPNLRIAIVSYGDEVARQFSYKIRNDIGTYDGTDGTVDLDLRLQRDSKASARWQLQRPAKGGVYAIGIGGQLTGRAVDVLFIDDPVKDFRMADSMLLSQQAWEWWQSVARTRLAPNAPVILILTRWHEADLAGRLLAKQAEDEAAGLEHYDRWEVINIPAQADHDPERGQTDLLGREPGEFMESARGRTLAQWQGTKAATAPRIWSALYQGKPTPDSGDVWQRPWWRRYMTMLWSGDGLGYHVECDEMIMSWDFTFKDTKSSDYVVGQVWARRDANVYLLDQIRQRLSFTDSLTAVQTMRARWPQARAILVEDKANGTAVIDTLKSKVPGLIAVTPHESKYARANAVAPYIQSGNVYLPSTEVALFPVEDLIEEASAFPNSTHDDQVDATSQALARLFIDGHGANAWIAYMDRKIAALNAGEPDPDDDPDAALKDRIRKLNGGGSSEPAEAAPELDERAAARLAVRRND